MAQTQAQTRNMFIKANPGVRRPGKKGYWYRCAHCGKWCGRPGSDKVTIPDNEKMEVDHIKPWSCGGSDEIWNLQPLCRPCNRSKSSASTPIDNIRTAVNTVVHPVDALKGVGRKAFRQSKTLKTLGLNKRK